MIQAKLRDSLPLLLHRIRIRVIEFPDGGDPQQNDAILGNAVAFIIFIVLILTHGQQQAKVDKHIQGPFLDLRLLLLVGSSDDILDSCRVVL